MTFTAPLAPKHPHAITQHGETRTDNYFWMRYREDPNVLAHLIAENGYCTAMTAHTQALQDPAPRRVDSDPRPMHTVPPHHE